MSRLLVVLALGCLAACARPTKANYDKVETDMAYEQVVDILGQPDEVTSAGAMGFSAKSATWKTEHITIAIQFVNEKVKIKSFSENR